MSTIFFSQEIAQAIVIDIRQATAKDSRFLWASQVLYETILLGYWEKSSNCKYLTITLVGAKGFSILLDILPLKDIDSSLKQIFRKLKQIILYPNQDANYSSRGTFEYILSDTISRHQQKMSNEENTRLNMLLVTSYNEEHSVVEEVQHFVNMTNSPGLNRITVACLASPDIEETSTSNPDRTEGILHFRTLWNTNNDSARLLKKLLLQKEATCTLKLSNNDHWKCEVDMQQVLVCPTESSIVAKPGTFVEVFQFVHKRGVSNSFIYGSPLRLTATANQQLSNERAFLTLRNWLSNRSLVAVARPVPNPNAILLILIPGSDQSVLMRNIASRELILPVLAVNNNDTDAIEVDARDDGLDVGKEVFHNEITSLCCQMAVLKDMNPCVIKSDLHNFIEGAIPTQSAKSSDQIQSRKRSAKLSARI